MNVGKYIIMVYRLYSRLVNLEDVRLINFRITSSGYRYLERKLVKELVQEAITETNKGFPGLNLVVTVTLRTLKQDDELAEYNYRTKEISLNGPKLEEEPEYLEAAFYHGISKAVSNHISETETEAEANLLAIYHAFMTKEMGKGKFQMKVG